MAGYKSVHLGTEPGHLRVWAIPNENKVQVARIVRPLRGFSRQELYQHTSGWVHLTWGSVPTREARARRHSGLGPAAVPPTVRRTKA